MNSNFCHLILIASVGLLTSCANTHMAEKNKCDLIKVSGTITKSGTYCGGMRPSDDVLESIRMTRPYSGFTIYVRRGEHNDVNSPIIDSTITDENGAFQLSLPKGTYVLISSIQKDKSILTQIEQNQNIEISNSECLNNWWNNGLQKIDSNQTTHSFSIHYTKKCFLPEGIPCLQYTGPLPP